MIRKDGTISFVFISIFIITLISLHFSGCLPTPPPPGDKSPIANFEATPTEGNDPLEVQFTDKSVSPQGSIHSWFWDFGDGETSTLPNPRKVYRHNPADGKNPSTYTVRLRVTTSYGVSEIKKEGLIRVSPGSIFTIIDPAREPYQGVVSSYGVTIRVPKGALQERTIFSIQQLESGPAINITEPMEFVSAFYRIAHDSKTGRLYSQSDFSVVPSIIEIPLSPNAEQDNASPNRYIILAILDDGITIPILCEKKQGMVSAPVAHLPSQATYAVAYFPNATNVEVPVPIPSNVNVIFPWKTKWRVFATMEVLRQLVALEKGNVDKPNSFYEVNFPDSVVLSVVETIAGRLLAIYTEFIASGFRNPILVSHNNAYGLIFFNMNESYTSDYEDFTKLIYADYKTGNLVIDPKQLLMVSIHNAIQAEKEKDNVDIKQKLTPYNVFSQNLFYACFDNYKLITLNVPDPSDVNIYGNPIEVPVSKGIRESIAVYLGQRADQKLSALSKAITTSSQKNGSEDKTWARGFTRSEYLDLSQILFQPASFTEKGYYTAGHEFWVYLERALNDVSIPLLIGASGDPYGGFLQELENAFETLIKPTQKITPELLLSITYGVLDAVIYAATEEDKRLADVYWDYARAITYERTSDAILRPSDERTPTVLFNESRFRGVPIPVREIAVATDKLYINPQTVPEIQSVLPYSSRAIKLKLNPLSSEANLIFSPGQWVADPNGNSLKFAIYHPATKKAFDLEVNGKDTDNDNKNDTLTIANFKPSSDECFDHVYLLVSNVSLNSVSPIQVMVETRAISPPIERDILKKYVYTCDPYYQYELYRTGTFPTVGLTSYVLKMISGTWRGAQEQVDPQPWTHYLTIFEPPIVMSNKALLFITGGSLDSEPDMIEVTNMVLPFVAATGTVAVTLQLVPNQPLRFVGETKNRVEDAIIAYSFDKYMDGYVEDEADMTWPALLPMVRSAVRAMDTVQKFVKDEKPGRRFTVDKFVVTGASKRGWTSWLTSAIDSRVIATMPIVIDVLNMPLQIQHHYRSYGGRYSPALKDYVALGIFDRLGTPEGDSLWRIVDPINYLNALTMPKFMVNSTGDQFFCPDSGRFYFNLLKPNQTLPNGVVFPENAYLYYAPNTDHGLASGESLGVDEDTAKALLAFYISIVNNRQLPKFVWWVEEDTSEPDIKKRAFRIRLDAITKPKKVLLWQATNFDSRDFRLRTLGPAWTSKELKPFCDECGGDPGFDPEAIFATPDIPPLGLKSIADSPMENKFGRGISGYLQAQNKMNWVYVEGTFYQMGYHYGNLMKDKLYGYLIKYDLVNAPLQVNTLSYPLPKAWDEILEGIADATGLDKQTILSVHSQWWKENGLIASPHNQGFSINLVNGDNTQATFVLWKPVEAVPFISVEPSGLVSMSVVWTTQGNAMATSKPFVDFHENLHRLQLLFNWLGGSLTVDPVATMSDQPGNLLCMANGGTYALQIDGKSVLKISKFEANIKCVQAHVLNYISDRGTIIVNENLSEFTLNELENMFFSTSMEVGLPKINEQFVPTRFSEYNYQVSLEKADNVNEGESQDCECEFGPNDIRPYVGTVPVPEKGWTGFFIQVIFPGPEPYTPELKDLDFVFSTRVVIVPDTYPPLRTENTTTSP